MAIQIQLSFPPIQKPLPLFFTPSSYRRRLSISASAMTATSPVPAATATMYELLSLPKAAGPDEIRAAYRCQARRWLPDVCPSSSDKGFFAEQFIRAREAYEVLSDPVLRRDYDLALHTGISPCQWSRKGADQSRAKSEGGFGDWESQLEGLKRRSAARTTASTWRFVYTVY